MTQRRPRPRLTALVASSACVAALAFSLPATAGAAIGVTLDAGGSHTCAVITAGTVKCWGADYVGQLGDASATLADQKTPVDVSGLGGVESVAAGEMHTCALTSAGAVKCWGFNGSGQLGDATNSDSSVPVDVSGLSSGVASIAVGDYHSCAITAAGGVMCWGLNASGQLGDGTTTDSNVPVAVAGLGSGVAAVAAGIDHTCVLTTAGGVKCWGGNGNGQLGDGTTTDHTAPADVAGLTSGVSQITAGRYHTCARLTSGAVKCWGSNWSGKIGDFTTGDRSLPTDVYGLASGVFSISGGGDHTCALLMIGGVRCWGFNASGQVGDGSTASKIIPVNVSGLALGVNEITTGGDHTCALLTTGRVKCFGSDAGGKLGDGATTDKLTPVAVGGAGGSAASVVAGARHNCLLTGAGGADCWGSGWAGQLGNDTNVDSSTPSGVAGLSSGAAAIAAGTYHSCAATTSGAAKCWGFNGFGELGDGTVVASKDPVDVGGLASGVTAITAGSHHSCAVQSAAAKCWGHNDKGQLGDGTFTSSTSAVGVSGLGSGVSRVVAGGTHSCALTTGGGVKCWGYARFGQLGGGSFINSNVPTDVTGLTSGVAAIVAGVYHTCALTTGGGVKCWGHNVMGELGNGTTVNSGTPVDVTGLASGVTAIAAGGYETCALLATGAVKCWGYNGDGQVGDGTTINRRTPVPVSGVTSGATSIAVGEFHACAVVAGAARCWGHDGDGQLGDGIVVSRVPVDVSGLTDVLQPLSVPPGPTASPPTKATVNPKLSQVGKAGRRHGRLIAKLAVRFTLPAGVDAAKACGGKISLSVKPTGRRKQTKASATIRRSGAVCKAVTKMALTPRSRGKRLTFKLRFPGNDLVAGFDARRKLKIR